MERADGALEDVERMLAEEQTFDAIEAYVNGLYELSRETRSALWLFAFTGLSNEERRQTVREMVHQADRGELGRLSPRPARAP